MTKVAALEAVGLGRRYRTKWGLRDCSLTVPEGSITGLVGPNGAGKSTLLRMAAGLSRPTTGTVSIFGETVKPNSTHHLRRMGYFDQLRPLYSGLRVDETLRFGQKFNKRWDNDAAVGWLNELNVPLTERVVRLSLGQQALVALALCMGKRPDLLLLDEPVASLDPLARRRLLETLLGTVAEAGTTVFLSSHIISELEPVCDHLIILSSSSVRISGATDALLAEHAVLVGSSGEPSPSGVEIISTRKAERQSTLLVRGNPTDIGPSWEVLQPDLDEIVLAYLERGPDVAEVGYPGPHSGAEGGTGS
jgi:ABC-2 type transport system ATP-binding protein